MTAYDLKPMTH